MTVVVVDTLPLNFVEAAAVMLCY